ncbi:transposase family protein [Streptomyces sp. NPDC059442]|uniref:helix-turn-helix domain-containing protein n=1 Tax=Streptomyces sp. NPDC059442 TaxID=3346830 RepID=UPI0036CE9181
MKHRLVFIDRLLATLFHLPHGATHDVPACWFSVDRSTVTRAIGGHPPRRSRRIQTSRRDRSSPPEAHPLGSRHGGSARPVRRGVSRRGTSRRRKRHGTTPSDSRSTSAPQRAYVQIHSAAVNHTWRPIRNRAVRAPNVRHVR